MAKSYYSTGYPTTEYPTPILPLDLPLLMAVCQQQGKTGDEMREMIPFLETLLNQMEGVELLFDNNHNMYITKGEADLYPCMVAHLDTVHSYVDGYTVALSRDEKVLYAYAEAEPDTNLDKLSPAVRQAGIGGDDRCGIAIALQLLAYLPYFKVAFFVEEECGGSKGSKQAYMPFFDNVSMVLQCDRNGSSDWVQKASGTQVASDAFITAIRPLLNHHKYVPIQSGGFTDVVNLKTNKLPVCAANMSCGYYAPHSSSETIHLPTMENTLNLCLAIYQLLGHEKQEHAYVPYVSSYSSSNSAYKSSSTSYGSKYFYPKDVGFEMVTLTEAMEYTDTNNKVCKTWQLWQLKDKDGNVLIPPTPFTLAESAYKQYQKKHAAAEAKEAAAKAEAQKKLISAWVKEDKTWELDRAGHARHQKGIWVKCLLDEKDGFYYDVAWAAKLVDIPTAEADFQAEYGKDLLEGAITVSEIADYIADMEEEAAVLEKEQQSQLRMSFGLGEGEDSDDNFTNYVENKYKDDEDRYNYRDSHARTMGLRLENVECPHCKETRFRYIGQWNDDSFYCDECGLYSDEKDESIPEVQPKPDAPKQLYLPAASVD